MTRLKNLKPYNSKLNEMLGSWKQVRAHLLTHNHFKPLDPKSDQGIDLEPYAIERSRVFVPVWFKGCTYGKSKGTNFPWRLLFVSDSSNGIGHIFTGLERLQSMQLDLFIDELFSTPGGVGPMQKLAAKFKLKWDWG